MNRNYNFNDYPPVNVNMQHMPVAIVWFPSADMQNAMVPLAISTGAAMKAWLRGEISRPKGRFW